MARHLLLLLLQAPHSQCALVARWGTAQALVRGKDAMTAVLHMAAG